MNSYHKICETARNDYEAQVDREGYPRTCLTRFRHGFFTNPGPTINAFILSVEQATSDDAAKNLIIQRLQTHKCNNHSYNMYLLDHLKKHQNNEDWEQYNPKKIITYTGTLYRGIRGSNSDNVFRMGMRNSSSDSIEDYLSPFNGSVGNSASKKFEVALQYALPYAVDPADRKFLDYNEYGHVYTITYQGKKGYDLVRTFGARAFSFDKIFLPRNEDEVNIGEQIKAQDILCAHQYEISSGTCMGIKYNPQHPKYVPVKMGLSR